MPFGLANAPATFQSYINRALSNLLNIYCIVYLDDILIYSQNNKVHEYHIRLVLKRLRRFRLYAKLSKCAFYTQEVNFLSFIVTPAGLRMEPSRTTTIVDWLEPQSIRDIQVFLRFCNFYRRFIEGYSRITAPLSEHTRGPENR